MPSEYPFDFYTAQSEQNSAPNTIVGAATITPRHKFTRITGVVEVTRIVPPNPKGYCELTLVFTSAFANALNTGVAAQGGIAVAYTSVADRPIDVCYDPRTGLWYPKAVV